MGQACIMLAHRALSHMQGVWGHSHTVGSGRRGHRLCEQTVVSVIPYMER